LGDLEELGGGEEVRRLAVIAADLIDAIFETVGLVGGLGLGDRDRYAIDEKDDVCSIAVDGCFLRPLGGDLEDVVIWLVEVDQPDIALAVLLGNEDRMLAAQPLQGGSVPSIVAGRRSSCRMICSARSASTMPGLRRRS
jgi:hypothetical protein